VDRTVVAAIIGALALIAAAVIPELLRRGHSYEKHRQRLIGIIVAATSTMFVTGAFTVVRLIELSKFGWALGALAVSFLGATVLIVGSLGVLAPDERPGSKRQSAGSIDAGQGSRERET